VRKKDFEKVCQFLGVEAPDLPKNLWLGNSYVKKLISTHKKYSLAKSIESYSERELKRYKLLLAIVEHNTKEIKKARTDRRYKPKILNYTRVYSREDLEVMMRKDLQNLKIQILSQSFVELRGIYTRARHKYITDSELDSSSKKLLHILPTMIKIPKISKITRVSNKHTKVEDLHKDFKEGEEYGQVANIRDYYNKELVKLKHIDYKDLSFTKSLLGLKSSKLEKRLEELKLESDKKVDNYLKAKEEELLNNIEYFTKEIEKVLKYDSRLLKVES
jgi:hypothetical protein